MALSKTKQKGDLKKTMEEIRSLLVDATDESFHVVFKSDDYGSHICYYVERNEEDKSGLKHRLPQKVNGWRNIYMSCPNGYIKAFFSKGQR